MRRLALIALLLTLGAGAASAGARSPIVLLCVGKKPGCYATIQAAVNAARNGDTIDVLPGTYAGGITIDKSLQLVGASAAVTVLSGGGPVVTIGDLTGGTAPAVSISRVTITGGLTNGSEFGGTAIAGPGGVFIPGPDTGNATAATVSISDSVITGNRSSPLTLIEPTTPPGPPCGRRVCGFAGAGGIENAGVLTLTNTLVTDNVSGSTPTDPSVATDAAGGGVSNHPHATLTLRHCVVSGNRAAVSGAFAQFASGGAIDAFGRLTVEDSQITGNSAEIDSSYPGGGTAAGGGIDVEQGATAMITRSIVSRNSVDVSDTAGGATVAGGGLDADGTLLMTRSLVDHNRISSSVAPGSGLPAVALGGAIENDGLGPATVRDSSISGNSASATSVGGFAAIGGGGVANLSSQVALEQTLVVANTATAAGAVGFAGGGGIVNVVPPGATTPPQLSLADSAVTANQVSASGGITPAGGGIFTDTRVTLERTVIVGNQPDQCVGC